MISGTVAEGVGLGVGQTGEHVDGITHVGKGLERGAEFEIRACGCGIPVLLNHAVCHIDEAEARRSFSGGGKRRDHGVEHGERNRGTEAPEKCAAREGFAGNVHQSAFLI